MKKYLALALGLAALHVNAAVITWYDRTTVTSASDVLNTGTFVVAESGSAEDVVVNGVTFAAANTANAVDFGTSVHAIPGYGNANVTGNAAFDDMLKAGYHTHDNQSDEVNFNALTIGTTYRIQAFVGSWDNNFPTSFLATNSVDLLNSQNVPAFVFGTFTADATAQSFTYQGTAGSFGIISAVALYAIPEPSTYAAIAGLCALGLAAWRRRRA